MTEMSDKRESQYRWVLSHFSHDFESKLTDEQKQSTLLTAAWDNQLDKLQDIYRPGTVTDIEYLAAIYLAASAGHLETVEYLAQNRPDALDATRFYTAIISGAAYGEFDKVHGDQATMYKKYITEYINNKGTVQELQCEAFDKVMDIAIRNRSLDIIKFIIEYKSTFPGPSFNYNDLLLAAIDNGNSICAEYFIKLGASDFKSCADHGCKIGLDMLLGHLACDNYLHDFATKCMHRAINSYSFPFNNDLLQTAISSGADVTSGIYGSKHSDSEKDNLLRILVKVVKILNDTDLSYNTKLNKLLVLVGKKTINEVEYFNNEVESIYNSLKNVYDSSSSDDKICDFQRKSKYCMFHHH